MMMAATGRSCCRIDDVIYAGIEGPAIPIKGCVKNWFNRWAPSMFFALFLICYLTATIPNAVLGNYTAFGSFVWMLILGFLFLSYDRYMPVEMKIDGSNVYINMGKCYIQPYLKLVNARIRKATKTDLESSRWPRCWCDEHNNGLNWAEYEPDINKLTCIQGDLVKGCQTFPAYVIIVPTIEGIDESVLSQMHA